MPAGAKTHSRLVRRSSPDLAVPAGPGTFCARWGALRRNVRRNDRFEFRGARRPFRGLQDRRCLFVKLGKAGDIENQGLGGGSPLRGRRVEKRAGVVVGRAASFLIQQMVELARQALAHQSVEFGAQAAVQVGRELALDVFEALVYRLEQIAAAMRADVLWMRFILRESRQLRRSDRLSKGQHRKQQDLSSEDLVASACLLPCGIGLLLRLSRPCRQSGSHNCTRMAQTAVGWP
jgi:hypothetical protein